MPIRSFEVTIPPTSGEVEKLVEEARLQATGASLGYVALHIREVGIDIRREDSEQDIEFEIKREPQWVHLEDVDVDTNMRVQGDVIDSAGTLIGTVNVGTSIDSLEPATLTMSIPDQSRA